MSPPSHLLNHLLNHLREAVPGDADVIARIQGAAFDDAWTVESVRGLLDMPAALSLLAADPQRRCVGFLIGQCVADTAEVISVAVDPGYRRGGWGMALLAGFEAVAAARGADRVILDVAADNPAALALYCRRGYETIARRDRYYASGRPAPVDALVMAKSLGEAPGEASGDAPAEAPGEAHDETDG